MTGKRPRLPAGLSSAAESGDNCGDMTKVMMVASEAAPFIKTGGLADVIGSLPSALAARGDDIAVVLPYYRQLRAPGARLLWADHTVRLGAGAYPVSVHQVMSRGVPFYFVQCDPLYGRDGIYVDDAGRDFPDNHVRFAVLCGAALDLARHVFRPQVLHCHDWQAALVPAYLRHRFASDPGLDGIKTLFTIHNLGYQGIFPAGILSEIGLDGGAFQMSGLEFFGRVNILKGALNYSDALSTVSRSYAEEIQTQELGFGLEGILRSRRDALSGIVNGVDYSEWNPETDPHVAANYSADDLSGKRACKKDLIEQFGLPPRCMDRPLVGIVSRFVDQKGFDLLAATAGELAAGDLILVALGAGDPRYETLFRELASSHPANIAVHIAYDNPLAHKIEAGADIFLMPSRYEPCGLNQIYSLRYGTVPVVRATGGLNDTIDESTGFKFREYSGRALLSTLRDALCAYRDPDRWKMLMRNGMKKDFSWDASAAEYSALYQRLAG